MTKQRVAPATENSCLIIPLPPMQSIYAQSWIVRISVCVHENRVGKMLLVLSTFGLMKMRVRLHVAYTVFH